ncbi:NUDIX hydrolase [Oerskovia flava]|uniref:NUDIX hydrolase n=1 Tax=Oerskovia flava TaxID=2986422 RepID=UPI00223EAF3C|nr:NUDIX hydrolase [Oerskovia sp. JB1-3-2]
MSARTSDRTAQSAPPADPAAGVLAAGGIVTRATPSGTEVMIIHRPKYDDWSFPKGKVDPGEELSATAVREVEEETALRCALGEHLARVTYHDETDRPKHVHYWRMSVVDDLGFTPGREVDDARWVGLDEARRLLTRQADRDLLTATCGTGRP